MKNAARVSSYAWEIVGINRTGKDIDVSVRFINYDADIDPAELDEDLAIILNEERLYLSSRLDAFWFPGEDYEVREIETSARVVERV